MAKNTLSSVGYPLASSTSRRLLAAEARKLWRAGRLDEAGQLAHRLLAADKNSQGALVLLGIIARDQGNFKDAETWFRRCIKVAPRHFGAHANLGGQLLGMGKKNEALACFRAAVKLAPGEGKLYYNLGQCFRSLDRYEEAIASYRRALELTPDLVVAASDLASVLALTGKAVEAEALCQNLIQSHPQAPEPRLSLGVIYRDQGRLDEARQAFEEVLRLAPRHWQATLNLAALLLELNQLAQAQALVETVATNGKPKTGVITLMAELRARQGDSRAAVELMTRVLASNSGQATDYLKLASWHAAVNNRAMAVAVLEEALKVHGDKSPLLNINLLYNQLCLGEWRHYRQRLPKVLAALQAMNPPPLEPFVALQIPGLDSEAISRITRVYSKRFNKLSRLTELPAWHRHVTDGRLRIGYLSADFHEHATAYLTASIFENHDIDRFKVYAYSYGPDDQSPTRQRLKASFAHFTNIRHLDHLAAAKQIRADGIDILVDLKGYTRLARPEILALRSAPIQVNWLGYPGTMGADFMDYIIVDSTVVPAREASAYQEALAYLPHAYAPVDTKRAVAPIPSRTQAGLPEEGFVLCCFNNPRKIIPDFFYLWCDLLSAVPNSVLWLFARQEAVIGNLRREAKRHDIDPERIIFASRVTQEEHLARLSLADLILDTLPYNAHTTTSDALFMGVPVLTCIGNTFAGRVAASLLRTAGLPDMVTLSLEDYRDKALNLASHPEALADLRRRLASARESTPYFDMGDFARHLEALYQRMWQRHEQGLKPYTLSLPYP